MSFLGRWLSQSISLAMALFFALAAMQAPAFTRDYASALLQVAAEARRDIDFREASARQFYTINAAEDAAIIEALRKVEPSNAETLERSVARAHHLRQAYDDINEAPVLLQPIAAVRDAWDDAQGDKASIRNLALSTYKAQIDLTLAAAVYGIGGVVLGSLIAQLVLLPFRFTLRRHRLSPVARRY